MFQSLENILRRVRSRYWVKGNRHYIVVFLVFIVWMMFFDRYRYEKRVYLDNTISTLEDSRAKYQKALRVAIDEKAHLEANKEKYAREKYLMHKADEDIFIIENQ